jgi:hypothetical protein
MRWMIFAGAARQGPRNGQAKRKTWSPATRLIWLVFVVGVAVQWPAGRVIVGIVVGLVVLGAIAGLAYGFAHRNDSKPAAPGKRAGDEALDRIVASWDEE